MGAIAIPIYREKQSLPSYPMGATREPGANKDKRLANRDRETEIVSRHSCHTGSWFPVPNFQLIHATILIINGATFGRRQFHYPDSAHTSGWEYVMN